VKSIRSIAAWTVAAILVAPPAIAQERDQEYTAKILEYTTEPFFLTPYVDHLPASATVPTPLEVLGHIVGAPDVLSYPAEVYEYMRAVADASPRVEVFTMGWTEEGREMILVVISDEETIANLDDYKDMLGRLADPRATPPDEADRLIDLAKPIYWATGAIHSPETGSPEMLMELAYRLAVDEGDFVREIRRNSIVMITPVIEVDGRAKVVDLHMAPRLDPDYTGPTRPLYWGKYVAHDNNRDGIGLSLKLSQNVTRAFLEYHPQIFHDLHESASHLYTSTGRGPYNAWLDPITINEWNNLAYTEVKEMTALGVPGVYTHDFYDGWAPNYMFWIAQSHNAIGRFYETQGAGNASTRVIRTNVERQWHRPNTPLPEVVWSIRNNVNLQQSAILIAMNHVAHNKEEFLRNYYRKGQRSVAKATSEGPAAYVFPATETRPSLQARLLRLMQSRGVEVHRATDDFTVGETEYPSGSYVIRMDQPYSRSADQLLDKQYYNPNDPRPYDDVGWTLGPLFNVETARLEDPEILATSMTLMEDSVVAPGGVENLDRNPEVYLIDYNAANTLTTFRYAHPGLRIEAAEEAFEADDVAFRAGSFVLHTSSNPADVRDVLAAAGAEYGFTAYGVSDAPDVSTHEVQAARVAIVHTWTSTQSEGWVRLGFDNYGVPYDYISVHDIRDNPDLRASYDVLVMGPSSLNALSVLRGVTGDDPLPWKKTEITPNIGLTDETDDMRGGLELQGVMNLAAFVEAGGAFVAITSSASIPMHFGLVNGLQIKSTPTLWARGGVFRSHVTDAASPIAYGYDDELGVYFNTAPVFATVTGGGRFGGFGRGGGAPAERGSPGSTLARRTGRGTSADGDVVQGRARDLGAAGVDEFNQSNDDEEPNRPGGGAAASNDKRIVFRFAAADKLLISGGLNNGQEMANAPALIDAKHGDGHVVLFSFNPFWRGETLGAYALVFNTLLHFDNLDAGATSEERATTDLEPGLQ
jgi:hypothetical protein